MSVSHSWSALTIYGGRSEEETAVYYHIQHTTETKP